MSGDLDQDLESLLESRPLVPAREDLAEQIITATGSHNQQAGLPLFQWLHGLLADVFRVEPAYAPGLLLLFGLSLGFAATWASSECQAVGVQVVDTQDYFYSTRSYL